MEINGRPPPNGARSPQQEEYTKPRQVRGLMVVPEDDIRIHLSIKLGRTRRDSVGANMPEFVGRIAEEIAGSTWR